MRDSDYRSSFSRLRLQVYIQDYKLKILFRLWICDKKWYICALLFAAVCGNIYNYNLCNCNFFITSTSLPHFPKTDENLLPMPNAVLTQLEAKNSFRSRKDADHYRERWGTTCYRRSMWSSERKTNVLKRISFHCYI